MTTRKLTTMAMFIALSVALVWLIHFPIFAAAPFLEYDPADIPILIITFTYGPVAGIITTVIAAVIQGLTVSASGGVYGIIMHIIATSTFVVVAGLIYSRRQTRPSAAVGVALGTLAMAAVMAVANLIVTPLFLSTPVSAVRDMLIPIIIPFNLIKAGINGAVTFVLYKAVAGLVKGRE